MEIPAYEGRGRKIVVEFTCYRCGKTATRPLKDCLPTECSVRFMSDLKPPREWRNGGFYHPTFCPECAEKYDRFMRGEEDGKA